MGATDAELDFVDEVAMFFTRDGMPLITGRVIGWLLISDPQEQSAAQLADTLRVSRSSISSAVRMLTPSGLVERVHRRGDRQEYFRIAPGGWSAMFESRFARATDFRTVTERGLALLRDAPAERSERLASVNELYRFLEEELPLMWQRWRERQSQQRGTDSS